MKLPTGTLRRIETRCRIQRNTRISGKGVFTDKTRITYHMVLDTRQFTAMAPVITMAGIMRIRTCTIHIRTTVILMDVAVTSITPAAIVADIRREITTINLVAVTEGNITRRHTNRSNARPTVGFSGRDKEIRTNRINLINNHRDIQIHAVRGALVESRPGTVNRKAWRTDTDSIRKPTRLRLKHCR